jgi:hypothetical protein
MSGAMCPHVRARGPINGQMVLLEPPAWRHESPPRAPVGHGWYLASPPSPVRLTVGGRVTGHTWSVRGAYV